MNPLDDNNNSADTDTDIPAVDDENITIAADGTEPEPEPDTVESEPDADDGTEPADTGPVKIKPQRIKWADTTFGGQPKQTMMNALQCIDALGLTCQKNVFTGRYTVNGSALQSFAGELSDAITRKIRQLSRARFGLDPGREHTSEAMRRMCEENQFHPVLDYLTGLRWDGKPRLGKWLSTYLGVKDTPLTNAQGRIVIMAAVRRILEPGCKFDHVLVLEGPEGTYKSSVARVLANGSRTNNLHFSDSTILNADERKQMELTTGVWVYEIAELAGMKKADQFAVKNFITKQEERARPAYAIFNEVHPRCCIFIGTFNTTADGRLIEYLNAGDQRRWWPVLVGLIDIPGLEADRDQLYAEAMWMYELEVGCDLFLPPELEAEAKGIAKSRQKVDPLADTLSSIHADVVKMLAEPLKGTTDSKPLTRQEVEGRGVLLIKGEEAEAFAMDRKGELWVSAKYVTELVPPSRKNDSNGTAEAMRSAGWSSVEDRRTGGKNRRGWVYTGEPVTAA